MSETLASLEKKREQLYKQLQESGDFRRGTISVVFREIQNWIGGSKIYHARFVPPPHGHVPNCMKELIEFLHDVPTEEDMFEVPIVVRMATQRALKDGIEIAAIGIMDGSVRNYWDNPGKPYEVRTMTHDIKQNLPHTPASNVIDRLKILHFTPHDLRRTAVGLMAEAKVELEHRERVLNHKKGKLDGTYNKYEYADEKQAVLEILERILTHIISDIEGPFTVSDTDQKQQKLEAWERDLVERE